jgi:hypothetical protein
MRRRVRWENVLRVAGAGLLVAVVAAWPRLAPPEPRLPGAQAKPLVPGKERPVVLDEEQEPRADAGRVGRRGDDAPRSERRGEADRRVERRSDERRRGDDIRRAERRREPRRPAPAPPPPPPNSPPQPTATAAPSPTVAQDPAAAEFGFEGG